MRNDSSNCSFVLVSFILSFNLCFFCKAFCFIYSSSSFDFCQTSCLSLVVLYHSFFGQFIISSEYFNRLVAFYASIIALNASSSFHSIVIMVQIISSLSLMASLILSLKFYLIEYFFTSDFNFQTTFFNESFSSSFTRVTALPANPAQAVLPTL